MNQFNESVIEDKLIKIKLKAVVKDMTFKFQRKPQITHKLEVKA